MTCSLRHQTSLSLCQWLKTASKLAMSNKQCISKQQTLQTSDRRSTMLQETVVLFFFSSFCSLFVESPQEMNSLDANLSPMGWKTDFKACFLHHRTAVSAKICLDSHIITKYAQNQSQHGIAWLNLWMQLLRAMCWQEIKSLMTWSTKHLQTDVWLTSVIIEGVKCGLQLDGSLHSVLLQAN